MGKPENFTVTFEGDETTFYAGQTIEGQVRFQFLRPERAKSLTIDFLGTESTYATPAGTKRVVEEHEIFKVRHTLWNDASGYFEAKSYVFPFKVELGAYNFPSSYEGEYANIRYKFKALIDRPSRFGHSTSASVTLLAALPNFIPEFTNPGRYVAEGTYGTFTRESLQLVAETKFRSCCPGGKLLLDVAVTPRNTRSINAIDLKLVQEVQVLHKAKPVVTSNIITSITIPLDPQNPQDEDDQELVRLPVPTSTPPTIETSSIVTVGYHILVTGTVAWSYAPLTVRIPVQIATLNVTADEVPPLASGHHYLPPTLTGGAYTSHDEPYSPRHSRHSFTPSLTSDVSSLYSHDSDESDSRRRSTLFQPNYAPGRLEIFPTHAKTLPPIQPLEAPRLLF